MSFWPGFSLRIMFKAESLADYCLFFEDESAILCPRRSFVRIGVSKLVGYTCVIERNYSSVLKLSKNPDNANLDAQ